MPLGLTTAANLFNRRISLERIGGVKPEPFEPAQRRDNILEIGSGDLGLPEHLDVPPMHAAQPIAQGAPLLGQPDMDRAAIVHRAFLHEIAIFDHLLDVVRDVRPEIAAAQCQLADRHLGVPDIKQHHALYIVDVVNAEPVELELDDFEKLPVKPLDQRDCF